MFALINEHNLSHSPIMHIPSINIIEKIESIKTMSMETESAVVYDKTIALFETRNEANKNKDVL